MTDEQYTVAYEMGTETPFKNAYWDNHEKGSTNLLHLVLLYSQAKTNMTVEQAGLRSQNLFQTRASKSGLIRASSCLVLKFSAPLMPSTWAMSSMMDPAAPESDIAWIQRA